MDSAIPLIINRPSVIFDVQGDETVVIDLSTGHYFRLNGPSTTVWSRLDRAVTAAQLRETCENPQDLEQLDSILDDLLQRSLVRVAGPADSSEPDTSRWRFEGFTLEQFTDLEDILGLDPIHEVDPAQGWPHVTES